MLLEKKWNILEAELAKSEALQNSLNINASLCKILIQRRIHSYDDAKKYFRPQLSDLHSPWLMQDMEVAVGRIILAIERKENILVYGDYDVDGTTAVACMVDFLRKIYTKDHIDYYIPNRYREGYGVSKAGIEYAAENDFSLIICLDCGIKSVELIDHALSIGIDFIICDHHQPGDILPHAKAILNPKQSACNYPYKELCGCSIGFKLISALCEKLSLDSLDFLCYLDLVAIATAADIVPLTGENRIFGYFGLIKLNNDPSVGIKSLIAISGNMLPLTLNNVAFMIAPRINAAGRMDDAALAVDLFLEKNETEADKIAQLLDKHNSERKKIEVQINEEAINVIDTDTSFLFKNSIVIFNANWHKGVVGIVAARLIEKYYRPTIVLSQSGDIVTGSARSVHGFDLYEAIHSCREHLLGYGGHFAAAGMSLHPQNVNVFAKSFEDAVTARIRPAMLVPSLHINAELQFRDIRAGLYNIITQMEPFGPQNAKPVFISRNIINTGYSKIVKDAHIRFALVQHNVILTGIGFNLAHKFHLLQDRKLVDIVYTIDKNEWYGQSVLQLKIIDICCSENALS